MAKKTNVFTTVTPLSKTIALILFILLPILGFYLGIQYEKLLVAAQIPSSALPPSLQQSSNR